MGCANTNPIFVKIGRQGGKITEYSVPQGTTLDKLFTMAGIKRMREDSIWINGSQVEIVFSYTLSNNEIIVIKRNEIKRIKVKVARVGEPFQVLEVLEGSTINGALVSAGRLPFSNEEIFVHTNGGMNGHKVSINDMVFDNDVIILEKKKPVGLSGKIYDILDNYGGMGGEEDEQLSERICQMLKKDYNIK